jgi:hypothetical protein
LIGWGVGFVFGFSAGRAGGGDPKGHLIEGELGLSLDFRRAGGGDPKGIRTYHTYHHKLIKSKNVTLTFWREGVDTKNQVKNF